MMTETEKLQRLRDLCDSWEGETVTPEDGRSWIPIDELRKALDE